MNNEQIGMVEYQNASRILRQSRRRKFWGWFLTIINGMCVPVFAGELIYSIFKRPFESGLLVGSLIGLIIYSLLTKWGLSLIKRSKELKQVYESSSQRNIKHEFPSFQYDDNKIVHTRFVVQTPYLTEVTIENNLLKIKSNLVGQRNRELLINLNDVTGIRIINLSLTPGYIGFELNGQRISDVELKDSPYSIVFADREANQYILELKQYVEYLMMSKQNVNYNQQQPMQQPMQQQYQYSTTQEQTNEQPAQQQPNTQSTPQRRFNSSNK